jgi:hypothetical protein
MDAAPQAQYPFRLYFDGSSDRQIQAASLIYAFDVRSEVELVDRRTPEGTAVPQPARLEPHAPDGQVVTGYPLFVRSVRSLRLLWPLALLTWIPGIGRVGNALYQSMEGKKETARI